MSYELHHNIKRHSPGAPKEHSLLKRTLDKLAYPVALVVPLSTLDQVLSIWSEKSAVGVSAILWIMLFSTSLFWIFYGFIHKEKAIIFGHIVLVLMSGTILLEIILFSR